MIGLPGAVLDHSTEPNEFLGLAVGVLVVGGLGVIAFPKTTGIASSAGVLGALIAAAISLFTSQTVLFLPILLVAIAFVPIGWIALRRLQSTREREVGRLLGLNREDAATAIDAATTPAIASDENLLVHSFGFMAPLLASQTAVPASAVATDKRLLIVRPNTESMPSIADLLFEVPLTRISNYSRGDWELPEEIDPGRRKAHSLMIDFPPEVAGGYSWVAVAKAAEWAAVLENAGIPAREG